MGWLLRYEGNICGKYGQAAEVPERIKVDKRKTSCRNKTRQMKETIRTKGELGRTDGDDRLVKATQEDFRQSRGREIGSWEDGGRWWFPRSRSGHGNRLRTKLKGKWAD
jgi:hypothetical protein